ncbi:MAG: helix-turn-helix domain-containing protein [candidate division Zixibacteria bacterium]|nr:helix-turn-helix domain-containing protein [candidate division Zixibacteria bacterium]
MLRVKGNSQSQADLNRTIGTVLRERRESLGLSWEDISKDIHIQVKYLRAVEDGHTIDLPDNIYFRMFAKVYSEQMGLSFRKASSSSVRLVCAKRERRM